MLSPFMFMLDPDLIVLPWTMSGDNHLHVLDGSDCPPTPLEDRPVATDKKIVARVIPAVVIHVIVLDRMSVSNRFRDALATRGIDLRMMTCCMVKDDLCSGRNINRIRPGKASIPLRAGNYFDLNGHLQIVF